MTRVMLAVDGNSLLHRSFHAQAKTGLHGADGRPIWAVRGLLSQLVAAIERIGPDAVIVGFDDPDASVRKATWPHYKAARLDKLDTLVGQLARAVEVLRALGIAVVVPAGLEADDVLASVARLAPTIGAQTVIVTSDRDSFALIDQHTRVLRILNGGVDASPLLCADRLAMMIGIRPDQYRDYAALRGDPSDNLPGVRGIGSKTAAKLLAALHTAREAFDDVHCGGRRVQTEVGPSVATRLAHPDARSTWERNCDVMAMHTDVELGFSPRSGPGLLPLAPAGVRTAFAAHQLSATLGTALRVLCRQEISTTPAVRTVWPPWSVPSVPSAPSSLPDSGESESGESWPRDAGGSSQRLARPALRRLPVAQSARAAQLSLF